MVELTEKDIEILERENPLLCRDQFQGIMDDITRYIDEKKNERYKGVLNTGKSYRTCYDLAVKYRNDFKCVNTG